MQWISNLSSPDNRALLVAAIAGVTVAFALIVVVVYRVAFGHRLRVPGTNRTRQPRLGLVDAFSLDGQRQLVLVRRDNIEHLIMIGGPNDVLVESQIIRAAVAPPGRERDAAAVKALPIRAVDGAPPMVAIEPPPPGEPTPPPRVDRPAAKPAEPPAAARAAIRVAAPVNAIPATAAAKPEPVALKPDLAPPAKLAPPAPAPARPAPYARPPLPPPIVVAPAARARTTPVAPPSEAPPAPALAAAPASIRRPPSPPPAPPAPPDKPSAADPFADLESLEAEMARLLGRDA